MNEAYQAFIDDMIMLSEDGIYDNDDEIISLLSNGESDLEPEENNEEVF